MDYTLCGEYYANSRNYFARRWRRRAAMITPELEDNINFTHADARRRRLAAVTVEHLILVLIDNSSVRRCLSACNADMESLRQDLEHFIKSQVPPGDSPRPTDEFRRVIKRAVNQIRGYSSGKASGAHVLAAVFAEPGSRAAYYLGKHGVERLAVLAHTSRRQSVGDTAAPDKERREENDLVVMAAAGRLELPFGRDAEVGEVARILARKYKNNPLLVGESGVGKTAIAHKLAHYALDSGAPPMLSGFALFSVSVGELVAGTKYRGDFELRMRQVLEKCRAHNNAALFIDEIHMLVGAGAVSGGGVDAANIMKPLLDAGVRCVGATTFVEYRRIFEKDAALSRRFHKIDINEPSETELALILSGISMRLAAHHQISYAPSAAAAAVKYSRRFLPGRFLPDKAVDLLDDAGARKRLTTDNSPVNDADIAAVAAAVAGVSSAAFDNHQLSDLAAQLSQKVIAQDEAAAQLSAAVLRRRLGYHDNGRTAGAFMFAGPTGVGKTEMARRLAEVLGAPLLRFDMSEYMESHSVSRLIGAPPGYVGFEQGGSLAEGIVRHPDAVVLLDEMEKAHVEVQNIFLQIMDYGKLTDGMGRRADFGNAILIMTSNAGAAAWERPPTGFRRTDGAQAGEEELSRIFSPEFRNRLDALIRFMPLSAATLSEILRLRIKEMQLRLRADKNISVSVGRRLRASLLSDGFSPSMGARPLQRLLSARILDSLAAAEAAGKIKSGGKYTIEQTEEGISQVRAIK